MSFFKRLGKFFKNVVAFEKENLRHIGTVIKEDPKRLILGVDEGSTKVWNKVLGRDDKPAVNYLGGATDEAYDRAESKGVDIGPGKAMHGVASAIASFYAGSYGMKAIGAGKGGATAITDGLEPINVTATPMSGGNSAVTAAHTAALAGKTGVAAMPAFAPAATKGGFLSKAGGFLSRNKDIVGSVIGGLGDAYSANAAADAELDLLRERDALTDANYRGANPSRTYRGLMPGRSTQTPQERFGPSSQVSQNRGFQFKYDARVGQIVRVPVEPVQQ